MSDFSVLRLDTSDAVATLTLNRPDALNALGPDFFEEMPEAIDAVAASDARVLVLRAEGRAFTAGLDLKQMGPHLMQLDGDSPVQQRRELLHLIQTLQSAITAVATCPVPVIAAIQGPCIGGGIDLVTACDVRLATTDATFSVRETKMAMVADLGTLQRLQRVVPAGHVAELVYTGRDVDAAHARRIGLVNDVFDDVDALQNAAHAMAEEIASNSPLAVQGAKHVLRKSRETSTQDGLDYVALWNAAFLQSDDLGEAFQAFLEKRDPEYQGQ